MEGRTQVTSLAGTEPPGSAYVGRPVRPGDVPAWGRVPRLYLGGPRNVKDGLCLGGRVSSGFAREHANSHAPAYV